MSKDMHFFATKADLLSVFDLLGDDLQFVRAGIYPVAKPDSFAGGKFIPNLGVAKNESAVACDSFLVSDKNISIVSRKLSDFNGVERFAFDQLKNENTIVFSPGGVWEKNILLNGRVSTVSEHEVSTRLMKRFGSAIRKKFIKVKAFYVGEEALEMLKHGKRLTIAAQSPIEFDLVIN